MYHLYKQGGDYKTRDGQSYSCVCVNTSKVNELLDEGWKLKLDDALAIEAEYKPVETSDYEGELRDKIKALGGTAGSRSKIETLEAQLKALEDDQKN